jgi:hypothetical protein
MEASDRARADRVGLSGSPTLQAREHPAQALVFLSFGNGFQEPIMRTFIVALAIAGLTTGALAQPDGTTLTMTCAQARGLVASQGAVVLRTSPTTYDRYVRDASFCPVQQMVRPAWIRTADAVQCPVGGVCRSVEIDNGR